MHFIYWATFCFSWGWVNNHVNYSHLCFFEWLSLLYCTLTALWLTSLAFHTAWTVKPVVSMRVILLCFSWKHASWSPPSLHSQVDRLLPRPTVLNTTLEVPFTSLGLNLCSPRPQTFLSLYYSCLVEISACLSVHLLLLHSCFRDQTILVKIDVQAYYCFGVL